MKIFFKSLLVILWLLVIFLFSHQNGEVSRNLTNGLLDNVFWFTNNDLVFIIIRKAAHFMEYFILGLFVYNLFHDIFNTKIIKYSILFCTLCACFDEFHQLFINDRNGNIIDIVIDSLGFICSIMLLNNFKVKKI